MVDGSEPSRVLKEFEGKDGTGGETPVVLQSRVVRKLGDFRKKRLCAEPVLPGIRDVRIHELKYHHDDVEEEGCCYSYRRSCCLKRAS